MENALEMISIFYVSIPLDILMIAGNFKIHERSILSKAFLLNPCKTVISAVMTILKYHAIDKELVLAFISASSASILFSGERNILLYKCTCFLHENGC